MSRIAVVFPGQGSQFVGMGKDFSDAHASVKTLFESADSALGLPLTRIMFDGPEEELRLTYHTQPALLTMSVGIWDLIKERVNVEMFAGHSLGEYSAIVAAGGMDFIDAVKAVHNRGKFMQNAVPVGVGAMAAVLGASDDLVIDTCMELSTEGHIVEPANFNCPGQLVVAGHKAAVEKFAEVIKERGAKRAVMLPVSAPFHCSLMRPAQKDMADYLDNITINDLSTPVYNNVDAVKEVDAKVVRSALIGQVSNAVRWTELVQNMIADGADTFIEVGAGTVLAGLVKKIDKSVKTVSISSLDDIAKLEDL